MATLLLNTELKNAATSNNVITSFGNGGAESIYLKKHLQGKTDSQQKSFRRKVRNEMKIVLATYKTMLITHKSDKDIKDFVRNYYNGAKDVYVNPANFFAGNIQGVEEKYIKLFSSEVVKYMNEINQK